jgi:hypothetical protein
MNRNAVPQWPGKTKSLTLFQIAPPFRAVPEFGLAIRGASLSFGGGSGDYDEGGRRKLTRR